MELHLSRRLQERRIFPAIDIERSSTRREELLIDPDMLQKIWLMRRMYLQMVGQAPQGAGMDPSVATEAILNKMSKTKDNLEFLDASNCGCLNCRYFPEIKKTRKTQPAIKKQCRYG